ncbi:hypothetical protein VM1G_09789 [Cytospora mali]|uniref:Prolyl 4-hydroxylase alpha subunit domain-containing protein n=1 Tax=Cytospora mali TaxID=578113 RepID=A0A194WDC1_CYTMA|nr:hypothetical protein VM1G_09789 [Valsa mali]
MVLICLRYKCHNYPGASSLNIAEQIPPRLLNGHTTPLAIFHSPSSPPRTPAATSQDPSKNRPPASKMFDFLSQNPFGGEDADPRSANARLHNIPEGKLVHMTYASKDVAVAPDFLSLAAPPPDAKPVTITPIDWASTSLPGNEGRFAVVLDNVLSPSECAALVRLAESSVDMTRMPSAGAGATGGATDATDAWYPAMVNAGNGLEVLESSYRNSDRIVWDCQEVVDRLWARCLQGRAGEVLRERMDVLDGDEQLGAWKRKGPDHRFVRQRWLFSRLNQRMRFLRYGPGQFFRPHCDGSYSEKVDDKVFKTFFTLHLYLNDSVAEAGEEAELVGGATSFVSNDGKNKVDVDPKAGRVLVFQHSRLYHCGDDVVEGTKYTMRTDAMYELVDQREESETEVQR